MNYPQYVKVVLDKLTAAGFEAYIVGGSLRDMIIGRTPSDFDVTTSALPDEILTVFSDMKTIPTGLKHGTITVIFDDEDGTRHPVEITTFRVDGEYLDSRHPESVSFSSNLCDDLSRRDFTVNAMAFNEKDGLVDYSMKLEYTGNIFNTLLCYEIGWNEEVYNNGVAQNSVAIAK